MTLKTTTNKKFEEISREYIDDGSEPNLDQLVPMFAEGFLKYMREHEYEIKKDDRDGNRTITD